jgi:nucleotide-binding universal stress UspA family protein
MLDGSPVAEEALPVVESLVGKPLTSAILFRAINDPVNRDRALAYLEGVATRLKAAGLDTECRVDIGQPRQLTGRVAQDADVVVLCTHGRGGFDRLRHGSVAEHVIRELDKPALLVRAGSLAS